MEAITRQPSHIDLDFVRTHVRRIAENMGIDQVYQDLAVFDAEDALRGGADRILAVHIGVQSAAHIRVAGRARVRRRPQLTLVPKQALPHPQGLTKPDHWTSVIGLVIGAIAIAAALYSAVQGLVR